MVREFVAACRAWARTPVLFGLNVFVLGAGIGGATALFLLLQTILLRPLPFDEADHLHAVWFTAPGIGIENFDQSPGTYVYFRDQLLGDPQGPIEEFGVYATGEVALTGEHSPRRLLSGAVTPSLFATLRAQPALGRIFDLREGEPGAERSVVLSHRLWQEQYGGVPILGESVRIDGIDRRVVGVMPASFSFPSPQTDLWLPLVIDRNALQVTNFSYRGIARLRPGVEPATAETALRRLNRSLPEAYPDDLSANFLEQSGMEPFLQDLRSEVIGDVDSMLWVLLVAVIVVLAIAAANVLNLMIVRADARASEYALRAAMGAGRGRLLRRAALDGLIVGLPAAAIGTVVANAALQWVRSARGSDLPRLEELQLGLQTAVFAGSVGVLLGLLLGLAAGWKLAAGRQNPEALRGTRSTTASRSSWSARRAFVVAQVAASTALLLAAGLLVRSFAHLSNVDPGFRPANLATLFVTLPQSDYPDAQRSLNFWAAVTEELASRPGVLEASTVTHLPFAVSGHTGTLVEEHPHPEGLAYVFAHRAANSTYFETAGLEVLAGRAITASDERQSGSVVVSAALAERFWGSPEAALEKRVRPAGSTEDGEDLPWSRIVGVVNDVRTAGLREVSSPTIYFPRSADSPQLRSQFLVLRLEENSPFDLTAARAAIANVDPNVPLARFRTGEELMAAETAHLRFTLVLLVLAAGTATAIGAFGLFAMLLTYVAMRRREIGVRLAIGATANDVRRLITVAALRLVLLGSLAGLVLSLASNRALGSFLYGVGSLDLLSAGLVLLLMVSVALIASLLPAARASRVDPASELRAE